MNVADFFISHASEDKDTLVRELANNLMINGALVFYDEYSIKLGDSLSESINKGISNAHHAIIVLSNFFFEKNWTNSEMQALFNRSLSREFRMLIVYHGVSHSDVAERYPLLADIKAIDSKVGIEKITEALMSAIGKKGQLSYLKHPFTRDTTEIANGFSISMFVGFPNFAHSYLEKVLFDLGTKNEFKSRLRLVLFSNRLYFKVIDSGYHEVSVSADVSTWKLGVQNFIHADLNLDDKRLYLFINDKVVDSLNLNDLEIDETFLASATGIIGNSLELRNPCQFLVAQHSIGKSMKPEMALNFSETITKYMNAINNKEN